MLFLFDIFYAQILWLKNNNIGIQQTQQSVFQGIEMTCKLAWSSETGELNMT